MKKKFTILLICIVLCLAMTPAMASAANTKQASSVSTQKKLKGLVNINGNYYYYSAGKPVKNKWKKIKGSKYYFGKSGKARKSYTTVKGVSYFFRSNGKLYCPKKAKLVTSGKHTFYVDKDGKMLKGWRIIGGKLYYFSSGIGKMLKSCKRGDIAISKTGAAKNNNATKLKIRTMKIVSKITNNKMSKSQKLRQCWVYVSGGRFQYSGKYPNLNQNGWQVKLALNMFETGSGNCYGFACAFAALAKEVGYKPVLVCGRVRGGRDGAADGYTRHCWVKIGGGHYDPEGQYAGWGRGIYGSSYFPVTHQIQKYVTF